MFAAVNCQANDLPQTGMSKREQDRCMDYEPGTMTYEGHSKKVTSHQGTVELQSSSRGWHQCLNFYSISQLSWEAWSRGWVLGESLLNRRQAQNAVIRAESPWSQTKTEYRTTCSFHLSQKLSKSAWNFLINASEVICWVRPIPSTLVWNNPHLQLFCPILSHFSNLLVPPSFSHWVQLIWVSLWLLGGTPSIHG